jgi:outer membrane protein TolC
VQPLSLAEAQGVASLNSTYLRMLRAQLDQAVLKEAEAVRSADLIAEDSVASYEMAQVKYLQPAQAAAQRRIAQARLAGGAYNLDLQVRVAYAGLLSAQRFLGLAETAAARAADQVRLTRHLEAAGMVARKDVLDAQAREADLRAGLATAQKSAELARLGLLRLLGDGRQELPPLDPGTVIAVLPSWGPEAYVSEALAKRFEIRQVEEHHALAVLNLQMAKQYPSGGLPITRLPDGIEIPGLPPDFTFEPSWERSERYTIPLAELQVVEAACGVTLQREEVAFQARSAYLDWAEASARAGLLGAAVDAAREGYRLAGLRYEAGMATNLETLAAELTLRRAETDQAHADFGQHLAAAKLLHVASPGFRSAGQGGM